MENEIILKSKHERFCREYFDNGGNGAKAAVASGYSEKSAAVMACKLLKREDIINRLHALQAQARKELHIDDNWAVLEAIEVYRRCMQAKPVMVWDYSNHEMIESGEYQFDSKGAIKALELIKNILGLGANDNGLTLQAITIIDDMRGKGD